MSTSVQLHTHAFGDRGTVHTLLLSFYAPISTCFLSHTQVFAGLLIGAMLPYWFSAMTMKSVGKAALAMVEEVRRQFNSIPGEEAHAFVFVCCVCL